MSKLVMVVNDSKEILELMQTILEEENYQVFIHSIRMHDLNLVKEKNPDLLIIDQVMGGNFAGWEFIQKMKLDRETTAIPIIMCTAATKLVNEIQEQLDHKNVRVILKPFDIDELVTEVKAAVGESVAK